MTDKHKGNHTVETIVDVLCKRTQNTNRSFFRAMTCYHLSKLASMMRVSVNARGFGELQCNYYAVCTAPSGFGKGYANKIIEEQVTHLFEHTYMETTMPSIAENSLIDLANQRALRKGVDEANELEQVQKEYMRQGAYITCFDSGTPPAIKQLRHKLLMANTGSINCEVDEFASNLLGNKDVLDIYLELYDGVVKPKLTKNTSESIRSEEIKGKTPTNMIMYGTPTNLFDASTIERLFMDLLTTGYARRCFFGFADTENEIKLSVKERLAMLTDNSAEIELATIANNLETLADPVNHDFKIGIKDDVLVKILEYQGYCEKLIPTFKSTDEIRKAECRGRYYKALRLAGVFAFIDSSKFITEDHWNQAQFYVEQSAKSFNDLITREPAFARLARYLAECESPVTTADLMEELPFFPKATSQQKDLIKHATAWGYRNNIIIKRSFVDDIEFIQGEALDKTNIDELSLSWSFDIARGYTPESKVPFEKLDVIAKLYNDDGGAIGHWANHHFLEGKRREANAIQGFNLIVLDVDGTASLDFAKSTLEQYTYFIYTSKSHQLTEGPKAGQDRFRIIIPMSHKLKMEPEEYKEFMRNVTDFLPFETDEQALQANRKWESNPKAITFSNEGNLFDVLPFINKTKKNEEHKSFIDANSSMDKLERYFYGSSKEGNRNNTLYRYGAALVDSGYDLETIRLKLKDFNSKLPKPLHEDELSNTVLNSIVNKFVKKGN